MSKREHGELNCCCTIKRSRLAREKKKHLYLVLDDREKGANIYKIDVDVFLDTNLEEEETRIGFPQPAILRLVAPVLHHGMNLSALGSKILIETNPECKETPTFVYDTKTAALIVGPSLPVPLLGGFGISVAAGEVLYVLKSYHGDQQHPLEAMSWASTGIHDDWSPRSRMDWSWKSVPSPPSFTMDDMITSYALHPDGQTIFMSAHVRYNRPKGIFSFNTKSCDWKWHGDWVLPFRGKGHFDGEHDVWVGLHKDGYICACEVASRSSTSSMQPDWKMVKELFRKEPERWMASTRSSLIYVGNNNFCLLECVMRQEVEFKCAHRDPRGYMLLMSMFGLKYNNKGELQTSPYELHRVQRCRNHTKLGDELLNPIALLRSF